MHRSFKEDLHFIPDTVGCITTDCYMSCLIYTLKWQVGLAHLNANVGTYILTRTARLLAVLNFECIFHGSWFNLIMFKADRHFSGKPENVLSIFC